MGVDDEDEAVVGFSDDIQHQSRVDSDSLSAQKGQTGREDQSGHNTAGQFTP